MKAGQTHMKHGDDTFGPVACPQHRGESVIDYRPSVGTEHLDKHGQPIHDAMRIENPRGGVEWSLPVYSEATGHDPTCRSCLIQAYETEDHVRTAHGLAIPRPTRPEGY